MQPRTSARRDVATPLATGTFVSGLFRVFTAGERLLVEQAELFRLDSRDKLSSFAVRFGLGALGAICIFTAWLGLLAAAVVQFDGTITLGGRLALAALAQLVLGAVLIAAARRRTTKGEGEGEGDA